MDSSHQFSKCLRCSRLIQPGCGPVLSLRHQKLDRHLQPRRGCVAVAKGTHPNHRAPHQPFVQAGNLETDSGFCDEGGSNRLGSRSTLLCNLEDVPDSEVDIRQQAEVGVSMKWHVIDSFLGEKPVHDFIGQLVIQRSARVPGDQPGLWMMARMWKRL